MRRSIFDVQGTDEQAARFGDTLRLISFPWWRCLPLAGPRTVTVRWAPMPYSMRGWWDSADLEIVLADRPPDVEDPFTIAHELGHLVDDLTFTDTDRGRFKQVMHQGGSPIQHHVSVPHREDWRRPGASYVARLHECYADLFVATFAPAVWDGTVGRRHQPRFIHHTQAAQDTCRDLTLRRDLTVFDDVDPDGVHGRNILDLAAAGIVKGDTDGKFRPDEPITRGQHATTLANALDVAAPGWR